MPAWASSEKGIRSSHAKISTRVWGVGWVRERYRDTRNTYKFQYRKNPILCNKKGPFGPFSLFAAIRSSLISSTITARRTWRSVTIIGLVSSRWASAISPTWSTRWSSWKRSTAISSTWSTRWWSWRRSTAISSTWTSWRWTATVSTTWWWSTTLISPFSAPLWWSTRRTPTISSTWSTSVATSRARSSAISAAWSTRSSTISSTSTWSIRTTLFLHSWNLSSFDIDLLHFDLMHTFDALKCSHFFARDEHDRSTISTRSTRSADTMDITLWIMRNMVVHDEIDIVHIESSRGDIRPDKNTDFPFLIVLQGTHAISLVHITMNIGRVESISEEIALELFSLMFSSGEDHHLIVRIFLKETLQNWILVSDSYTHKWVIDRINRRRRREDEWLCLSLDMRIEYFLDRGSIGRGKCENLSEWLQWFPDLCHRRSKSHIHHLIDLIEDECCDIIEIDPSTFHEVDETSWSGDDNLRTGAESLLLLPDRRTTEDCEWSHTHVAREIEYLISCLARELTSRFEDEDLWNSFLRVDRIEWWDTKCCCLPTSGLRLDNDIFACECERDDLRLHSSRFVVAEISEGLDDLWAEFECRKRHNKKENTRKKPWKNIKSLIPKIKIRQSFEKKQNALGKISARSLASRTWLSLQIGEKRYDNYIAPHRVGFREHYYIEKVGECKKKMILTNDENHNMASYCSFTIEMYYINWLSSFYSYKEFIGFIFYQLFSMNSLPDTLDQISVSRFYQKHIWKLGEDLIQARKKLASRMSLNQWLAKTRIWVTQWLSQVEELRALNTLIVTANYRWVSIPKWWLEVIPGIKLMHCGKVRNTFVHVDNPDQLIIVATDRISTHDVVHLNEIPWKWEAITAVSDFWFATFAEDIDTKHIPTQRALTDKWVQEPLPTIMQGKWLEKRTNIAKRLRALPVEAIVRWYLYGSALKDYDSASWKLWTGEYVGEWLKKCSQFNTPLFTPSTKWEKDINIDFDGMVNVLKDWLIENCDPISRDEAQRKAKEYAETIREYSLALYKTANKYAQVKWLTLGDTKFEFALDKHGKIVLIDEVCTPDSSRYWSTESIVPWNEPEQFDKQAVRDYVMWEWKRSWETESKPPKHIPAEIMAIAQSKYGEIQRSFSLSHIHTRDEVGKQVATQIP